VTAAFEQLIWPPARAGQALLALAAQAGLAPRAVGETTAPKTIVDDESGLGRWLDVVGRAAGVAVESVETTYEDVDRLVRRGAPALVRLGERGVVAITGCRRRYATLLAPDQTLGRVAVADLRAAVVAEVEAPLAPDVDRLLEEIDVAASQRARARRLLLAERLTGMPVGEAWLLRLAEGAPAPTRLRRSRVPARLAALLATHVVEYGLWIVAWVLLGRGVLEGRLDTGWLAAWLLLLVTLVPFRAAGTWLEAAVTVEAGGLLRRRLLAGGLRLDPEEIRRDGIGRLLGRVLEADAVDALALGGGLVALTAGIELVVVLGLLLAAAQWLLVVLLVAWLALVLALGARYLAGRGAWTAARLGMTDELVERMVGHRTRRAQERAASWHAGEDRSLEDYLAASRRVDRAFASLAAGAGRGWLVVGLAGLAPAFVAGVPATTLAVGLGCVLLAARAVRALATGLAQLAGALIAWRQVAPLFAAATRPEEAGTALAHAVATARPARSGTGVLRAEGVVFRHAGRDEPVLRGVGLRIETGDRVLMLGPSGAGKSTLASLLAGLRAPQGGVLLLDGLDRQSLGTHAWRRRVVAAPQFHENHLLGGTFLFNALMGSDVWPPRRRDLDEVEAVCRELGLEGLLARMPAGLLQLVGETGWQLSHGERSRLYVARALLQRAEVVVLDESFGALDPENLERALRCVRARARTLVVIAHP